MVQKLFQVLDSAGIGGAENYVFELSRALQSTNFANAVVFLRQFPNEYLIRKLNAKNISVIELNGHPLDLYRFLNRNTNCLLHTHGYRSGVLGKLFAQQLDIPVVSTYHSGARGTGKVYWYNLFDESLAKLSHNIAVSDVIADRLPKHNTHVIDTFVQQPDQIFLNRAQRLPPNIAFIGRVEPEKGPQEFCRCAQLNKQYQFHLFGDGSLLNKLKLRYASLENLVFHGSIEQLDNFWPAIDLVCMPSQSEGLPLVALEAMIRGIPVVAYAVGGLPKLIKNNENSFLVRPGDLESLCTQLDNYFKLPVAQQHQIAINANQTIKQAYTVDALLPKILHVYQQAIHGG